MNQEVKNSALEHAEEINVEGESVLGLDIGVASLGWALVRLPSEARGGEIIACGSHLFEAGTDGTDLDRLRGTESPRNTARRDARLMRRQIWRRWRRKRTLIHTLQKHGILPAGEIELRRSEDVDSYIKDLDNRIRSVWANNHTDQQVWLYKIREAAASKKIELEHFGRALYHLVQRRGFLSNRRTEAKEKDDERSEVKTAIKGLAESIAEHSPSTLGAYLASLDPDEQRIRSRWTGRSMYIDEFNAIWDEQAKHHNLSNEARTEIFHAIFHQRKLRSQKNLIGKCSLIPNKRRCPIAHRKFQLFRVLQSLTNLTLVAPGQPPRPLTDAERETLLDAACREGDLTWAKVRKLLGLTKLARFNLQDTGEKGIRGHRTDSKLRQVFGERFDGLSEAEKDQVVDDLRSFRLTEALERRGRNRWGLSAEQAMLFADIDLEEGYGSHCLKALDILLSLMQGGMPYATARKTAFPEKFEAFAASDRLPPVLESMPELRNPGVTRALTEVRKLVNEIVRQHGKPSAIRVELARDVKNPRSQRERLHKQMNDRRKQREKICAEILEHTGIPNPSRDDIERVLLADECGWACPYTGESIRWGTLLGRESQFDVEHIWPRSRSLDDGYNNKTLCYNEENRNRKKGRTPFEAYAHDTTRWNEILDRVARFKGDVRTMNEKLRRFIAEEMDPGFTNRHLSDSRYIARAAMDYLEILYGGRADAERKSRVQVRTGGLTAWLRSGWGLSDLLGSNEDGSKSREDHRHHAVDAIVIALTDQRAVQQLARAAERADREFRRKAFDTVEMPWPGFRDEAEKKVSEIIVSHRQGRKVRGELHQDTYYSQPHNGRHRVRKELEKLTPDDIKKGRIIDKRALAAIEAKLTELGKPNPTAADINKLFGDAANAPEVRGADGKMVRLRKVRIEVDAKPSRIGKPTKERFVKTASNHHTVVWEVKDKKGNIKWEHEPVTLMEAYRRVAAKEPVVNRDGGPNRRFLFSLAKGEHIRMNNPKDPNESHVYRVLAISEGEIKVVRTHDARQSAVSGKDRTRIRGKGDQLREFSTQKVLVNYLGEIRRASD